jgi:hydrogenase maturation protease
MMGAIKKILVYGFGNPGRQDDGLGPALAEMVEDWKQKKGFDHIRTDCNYQLNVEDALLISGFDVVIFADATVEESVIDHLFGKLDPATAEVKYTLHAANPGYIVNLCNSLYNKFPETYLVRIKGYKWEMKEGLTKKAQKNLAKAFDRLIKKLEAL